MNQATFDYKAPEPEKKPEPEASKPSLEDLKQLSKRVEQDALDAGILANYPPGAPPSYGKIMADQADVVADAAMPAAEIMPLEDDPVIVSQEEGKAIVAINDKSKALVAMFSQKEGLDPVIQRIRDRVAAENFDVTTKEGRERMGSVARQIGTAKMDMKRLSSALTEDWRIRTKAVTAETSRMEKEMDSIRDEILEKRDEYERIEKERVDGHTAALAEIERSTIFTGPDNPRADDIAQRIVALDAVNKRDWQEFKEKAGAAYTTAMTHLTQRHTSAVKWEADQAELERLRVAEETRKNQHQYYLDNIAEIGDVDWTMLSAEDLEALPPTLEPLKARDWQEFAPQAQAAITAAEANISAALAERKKYDADQAELEKRRSEDAENERIRQEHEKQQEELKRAEEIRVGGHKAQIERMKRLSTGETVKLLSSDALKERVKEILLLMSERDWQEFADEAKAAADEATKLLADLGVEAEKREAAERQQEADKAAQAERDRIAEEQRKQKEADDARAADEAHKAKINGEAFDELLKILAGPNVSTAEVAAKAVIAAIADGKIPHTTIKY